MEIRSLQRGMSQSCLFILSLHKPTESSKQHSVQDKPLGWLARKEANLVFACRKPETDQKRQDETNRLHGIATRAVMN